ncbi:hypothetical protein [Jiangella asiatica]|uniref:Uncharacterized protein n=1 Tax=Jiangella asiatica TaxID=2530372 RepID=A0A4R5DEQ8_9ACTN|nr:hypothetical protein [Jiangella asiatica]TDE09105.1 hypothetical protein E1269_15430 [Jiangella asiatica]
MSNEQVEKVRGWLTGRLPDDWFEGPVEVTIDREEITIVGRIPAPPTAEGVSDVEREAALSGRVSAFRESTRERRIEIARELEHRSGRKVAWGVECGDRQELFTRLAAPVMTRLRQPERQVLDTLVDAGVARSRSEALAWCVKLVAKNADTWLADLRQALTHVEEVRSAGPTPDP